MAAILLGHNVLIIQNRVNRSDRNDDNTSLYNYVIQFFKEMFAYLF